jgi:hypothetical protein
MRGIKLTIVLKQKFPVGGMASFASPPAGAEQKKATSFYIRVVV